MIDFDLFNSELRLTLLFSHRFIKNESTDFIDFMHIKLFIWMTYSEFLIGFASFLMFFALFCEK